MIRNTYVPSLYIYIGLILASNMYGRERTFGWCEQGGQSVTVGSQTSSPATPIQRSYPNCTVTVTYMGTLTLASLYSNDNGTPQSNPFTANANGYWYFYADPGRYDVKFSAPGPSSPITEGDVSVGLIGGAPYTVNATTSPQTILEVTHGQGPNVSVDCYSLPLVYPTPPGNYGYIQGNKVICAVTNDGKGNLTIQWFDNQVGSIMVSASGYGPYGPSGPAGYGAYPFTTNAGISPLVIPASIHHQGTNIGVSCWTGALNGANVTGTNVLCMYAMDPSGNGTVTVTWGDTTVGSVMIMASGRAQPFVINATVSPQTILETSHLQGFTPDVTCWDGVVSGSATQGNKIYCAVSKNPAGDVTVTWSGSTVKSIQIQ